MKQVFILIAAAIIFSSCNQKQSQTETLVDTSKVVDTVKQQQNEANEEVREQEYRYCSAAREQIVHQVDSLFEKTAQNYNIDLWRLMREDYSIMYHDQLCIKFNQTLSKSDLAKEKKLVALFNKKQKNDPSNRVTTLVQVINQCNEENDPWADILIPIAKQNKLNSFLNSYYKKYNAYAFKVQDIKPTAKNSNLLKWKLLRKQIFQKYDQLKQQAIKKDHRLNNDTFKAMGFMS